jgi:putative phage-type endonuclease
MKIVKLEQKSPEWLKWREDGIGGSEIGTVVGVNPYQTAYQLFLVKAKLKPAEDLSNNFFVKRGNRIEPIARQFVNGELNAKFEELCGEHDAFSWAKYSSDGVDWERGEIIEIKGMGDKNHQMILDLKPNWKLSDLDAKNPLKYYMPQMQYGMAITETKLCHFVSYNPAHPMPYKRVEIKPDKDMQDFLFIQGGQFWKAVLTKTPPELTEKDFEQIEDEKLDELVLNYRAACEQKKMVEGIIDEIKEQIRKHTAGKNVMTPFSKVFSSLRMGAVDYSKIEALKGVDLEKYRKPSSSIFYIK